MTKGSEKWQQSVNEGKRLAEVGESGVPWRLWGSYLSERQWGTVREDYSDNGDAWGYFTHDQARSRAYRWGEDGLAGICDSQGILCFALALWNCRDSILKERLFGLTNSEGNHGEDVKEYYFYLDNTPTHSYMKYLYKYPQAAFPYTDLVATNRLRSRLEPEYELLDTGIFTEDRYFDVFVEYAKADPEDILIRISIYNRGPDVAPLHLLPTLWFRNTWSWQGGGSKPIIQPMNKGQLPIIFAHHTDPIVQEALADYYLYCDRPVPLLFTENESNTARLFDIPNQSPFVKDGFNNYLVNGQRNAINATGGTKAAPHYQFRVTPGSAQVVRLRLTRKKPQKKLSPFYKFDDVFRDRIEETDTFYRELTPATVSSDAALVMRQALAGMLWTKQFYYFDADRWLQEHEAHPLHRGNRPCRNRDWYHMINNNIISMPDKWEYPWYAAWDLAFHTLALSIVDMDFAKDQLYLMFHYLYLHPSGQIPAYEWNFSDVNPPVHAWAVIFLHRLDKTRRGEADYAFLKSVFNKLMLNFTWWVNRKDRFGKNVFEGGFLGLDNIGVFDRSAELPTGGYLEQADGTAWMALYCQNMAEISTELTAHDRSYEEMNIKFTEHFLYIASALNGIGTEDGMWDEEDGFYYDVLRLPDGSSTRLKVRSIVGLLPLCATTIIEPWQRELVPGATACLKKRMQQMPELLESIHASDEGHLGVADRGILALVNEDRLRRILSRMLDEQEFLSPYGIRALSKYHFEHPYIFQVNGQEYRVDYLPADSDSGMFGGNSNWRGPVWIPLNVLLIRALHHFFMFYGDNFRIACPTGSGRMMNLFEVGSEISHRLTGIFLRDEKGRRPVFGDSEKFQTDPHWRDYLLFYEYFHGDNGAGLGASHQTGWTGGMARLIEIYGFLDPKLCLKRGREALFSEAAPQERSVKR